MVLHKICHHVEQWSSTWSGTTLNEYDLCRENKRVCWGYYADLYFTKMLSDNALSVASPISVNDWQKSMSG